MSLRFSPLSRVPVPVLFLAFATAPATAQEGGGLMDIDIGDIDLNDAEEAESITYQGTTSKDSPNYKPGTPVTITHYHGTVSVRCTESEGLTARIQYSVDGTDRDDMERFGKGIGIATWASNSSGSVKTRIPGKYGGVEGYKVPLVVNLPKQARVRVNGRNDWIQVIGCEGTVRASTRHNGIFVKGTYSSFDLSASEGDIGIELTDESEITAASRAVASNGAIELHLPLTQAADLSVSGSSVTVAHLVNGTNLDNRVSGTINDGGPSISLQAEGEVTIKAPE